MPSTSTPKTPLKTLHELKLNSTREALNAASLTVFCLDELSAIFSALVDLSADHDVVFRLAKVGLHMANTHRDTFDYEQEELQDKFDHLREVNHA